MEKIKAEEKEMEKIQLQKNESGNQENQSAESGQRTSVVKEILSYVWIIAAGAVMALLINRFVLINAVIPSESMENLLQVDDKIFGCRLSYLFEEPKRYDVIMFHYPVDGETIYIKRLIGLPGETVEIKDGRIYIDGSDTPIEENYMPEKWVSRNDGYVFEVPQDSYLMLGDNRNISEDARDWAQCAVDDGVAANIEEGLKYTFVHKDALIGRAVLKYSPEFHWFLNF